MDTVDPLVGGGTKLKKNNQMGPPQQQMQMDPQQQQQMQMQRQQQMQQQQMQMGPPQQQQMQMQQQVPIVPMPVISKKSSFGNVDTNSKYFKYSLLVVLIFIILNSKIIWKQISRLPFMGQVEPSILALIVNSILAGIIFYAVLNFVLK